MRKYELPMDEFLTKFKRIAILSGVSRIWSYGEFNGLDVTRFEGFFCDGNDAACVRLTEFLQNDSLLRGYGLHPVCASIRLINDNTVNLIYDEGKFYSALNDVESWGTRAPVELKMNSFLSGFAERLKSAGIDKVWTTSAFYGEKDPGIVYLVDSYTAPYTLDDYVDPYAENDYVYSDSRSYCMPTQHLVPNRGNLIYVDGKFYGEEKTDAD